LPGIYNLKIRNKLINVELAQLLQDLTSLPPTILLEKKTVVGCYTGIQNSSGWKAETSFVWLLEMALNNGDCSG
jgi:hypothetical protein